MRLAAPLTRIAGRGAVVGLLLMHSYALACACDVLSPTDAGVVFSGTVGRSVEVLDRHYFLVDVSEVWKGQTLAVAVVRGSGNLGCEVGFEPGRSYLFSGAEEEGRIVFDRCTGSQEVGGVASVRPAGLGGGKPPMPIAIPIGIASVMFGAVLGFFIRRRQRGVQAVRTSP